MLLSELFTAPIEEVIACLYGRPDFVGEAVAKAACFYIRNGQTFKPS